MGGDRLHDARRKQLCRCSRAPGPGPRPVAAENTELHAYLCSSFLCSLAIAPFIVTGRSFASWHAAVRDGGVSSDVDHDHDGFSSADFNLWPAFPKLVLLVTDGRGRLFGLDRRRRESRPYRARVAGNRASVETDFRPRVVRHIRMNGKDRG